MTHHNTHDLDILPTLDRDALASVTGGRYLSDGSGSITRPPWNQAAYDKYVKDTDARGRKMANCVKIAAPSVAAGAAKGGGLAGAVIWGAAGYASCLAS